MKRSEVNKYIKEMEQLAKDNGFQLPPFCNWTPEEWAEKAKTANEEGKCDCDWDYYLPLMEGRLSSMKESLLCEVRD